MENRKSFIIHYDSLDVIDDMSDEEVGRLFRKMKSYHNGNTYVSGDKIADIAFSAFKNQFDRDLERYDKTCERNRRNGLKGGRPQVTQDNPKEPTGLSGLQKEPKEPYSKSKSKSKSDSKNDNDNNSNIIISSKEDKELALVPEFGKDEINLMQKFLRQAVGVSAFKDTKERWYVTHCYNLMKKIGKDEFQHRLKTILQDEFKAKNANKLQYLYNEIKAFIHSPVIEISYNQNSKGVIQLD